MTPRILLSLFLTALVVVPVGVAQQGRIATDYVRIAVEPEFQYRTDMDVVLPIQVRVVRGGVPQPDRVSLEVRTENGTPYNIPGGQEWLRAGAQPYPSVAYVNLGRLEPGLYRAVIHASSGELERAWLSEFDVVHAPLAYEAALLGAEGKTARFVFEAHDPGDEFTVTMYRDSPTGRVPIYEVTTNKTTLRVPYIPGEAVKIDVADANGWRNYENRETDWRSGITTYYSWTWNPDFDQIENYKAQSWREAVVTGTVLLAVVAAWAWMRRRSP